MNEEQIAKAIIAAALISQQHVQIETGMIVGGNASTHWEDPESLRHLNRLTNAVYAAATEPSSK